MTQREAWEGRTLEYIEQVKQDREERARKREENSPPHKPFKPSLSMMRNIEQEAHKHDTTSALCFECSRRVPGSRLKERDIYARDNPFIKENVNFCWQCARKWDNGQIRYYARHFSRPKPQNVETTHCFECTKITLMESSELIAVTARDNPRVSVEARFCPRCATLYEDGEIEYYAYQLFLDEREVRKGEIV